MKLERTKVEYLGIQEGSDRIKSMILVNVTMPTKDFPNGMGTIVYNPAIHKLSWADSFKMKCDLGYYKNIIL